MHVGGLALLGCGRDDVHQIWVDMCMQEHCKGKLGEFDSRLQIYTFDQVKVENARGSCWLILDGALSPKHFCEAQRGLQDIPSSWQQQMMCHWCRHDLGCYTLAARAPRGQQDHPSSGPEP